MFGYKMENKVQTLLSVMAGLALTSQEVHPGLDVPILLPLPQTQLCGVPVPTSSASPECCPFSPTFVSFVTGLLMPPQR